jgi:autotransporter-associated beta strand protein
MQGDKTTDLVGPLTLNGGTVQCRIVDPNLNYKTASGAKTIENAYLAFQLGGTVTVTGSSPSFINGNQQALTSPQDGFSLAGASTTFNVADVTGDANPDLTISAAIGDVDGDWGGTFPTAGTLVKAGAGTMVLSGLNFYDGGTTVSAGTLVAGTTDGQAIPATTGANALAATANAAGAFGKPATTLTLGDANTPVSSTPTVLIGGAYTVGHPITVASQANATDTIGGSTDNNATFSGAITLNQGLTISQVANAGANTLTISGGIAGAGSGTKTLTFAGPGNMTVTTAVIANGTGGGNVAVNVTGGTLTLSTTGNTYTGNTTIGASGRRDGHGQRHPDPGQRQQRHTDIKLVTHAQRHPEIWHQQDCALYFGEQPVGARCQRRHLRRRSDGDLGWRRNGLGQRGQLHLGHKLAREPGLWRRVQQCHPAGAVKRSFLGHEQSGDDWRAGCLYVHHHAFVVLHSGEHGSHSAGFQSGSSCQWPGRRLCDGLHPNCQRRHGRH